MKFWQALVLLIAVWGGLYLPYLGTEEIRGEEARRILPGRTMMQTGDWLVPKVGGEEFNRKPPLINWVIAGSFIVTGVQNEWTARLPSVLWLLAFGVVSVAALRRRLGTWRALCVPLFMLTTIGMLDKGRMAEIEAMYIALFGTSFVLWASWWADGRKWLAYTVPWIVLGVAMLAKGPVHLAFWYPIVLATLWRAQRRIELVQPPHLAGVALMLGVFLPWLLAVLNREQAIGSEGKASGVWAEQLTQRMAYKNIDWGGWVAHPFEIVVNFLPWSILLIWAWWITRGLTRVESTDPGDRRWDAVIRGGQFGILFGIGMILITPEGLPRYSMPLFPVAAVVLVDLLGRIDWNRVRLAENRWRVVNRVAVCAMLALAIIAPVVIGMKMKDFSMLGMSLSAVVVAGVAVFLMLRQSNLWPPLSGSCLVMMTLVFVYYSNSFTPGLRDFALRKAGAELTSVAADPARPLVIYDAENLQMLFYVTRPYVEVSRVGDIPPSPGYFLVDSKDYAKEKVVQYLTKGRAEKRGEYTWEKRKFVVLEFPLR